MKELLEEISKELLSDIKNVSDTLEKYKYALNSLEDRYQKIRKLLADCEKNQPKLVEKPNKTTKLCNIRDKM